MRAIIIINDVLTKSVEMLLFLSFNQPKQLENRTPVREAYLFEKE